MGIARESSAPADEVDQVVAITRGGLASSATSVRTWKAGDREVHHILDPRTGDCAAPYWVLVSATGASCVDANLVTTAAIVWGREALGPVGRLRSVGAAGARRRGGLLRQRLAAGAGGMSSTALWYATRASGLMALILLTLTMVLGITTTTRARARNWPGLRPAGDASPHLDPRRRLPRHPRADQRARHLRQHQLGRHRDPVHLAVLGLLGRRRRRRARPDDRRVRHQPPPRAACARRRGGPCTGWPTSAGRSRWRTPSAWAPTPARGG